jgi:hypothetical protein
MANDEVECPFCGEPGEVQGDYDPDLVGEQVFIQDCEVCCRPWNVSVRITANGGISFTVQQS